MTGPVDPRHPQSPIIPPQDDEDPTIGVPAPETSGIGLGGQGNTRSAVIDTTAIQPEQIDRILQHPDIAVLMRYLTEKYAREDEAAARMTPRNQETVFTPVVQPTLQRNLLGSLNQAASSILSPQDIYEELAINRQREADLAKSIKEMKSQMHRATSSAPDIDKVIAESQQTPFTARISGANMTHIAKLKIPTYVGKGDPASHMTAFTIATGRARLTTEEKDGVLCQLFVETLSDAALQWFAKLKPRSIDSFSDLSQAFMKKYSILISREESTADLWNLIQKKDESLRSYIEKFKSIASRVIMDDTASIEALRRGLWYECRFRETLASNKPLTLEDALHRATTYINIEEERLSLQKQHASKSSLPLREKAKVVYR